jgi:Ca2+-dependent lipid-binding protein
MILIATRFKLNAGTTDPIWNQEFAFNIDNEVTEVVMKLFDKDDLRADDPLGTAV